jgi:hypothetical protein
MPTTEMRRTMDNCEGIFRLLLIGVLATGVVVPVTAQQPGEQPNQPVAQPQQPPLEPKDPAVAAVLRGNPTTPPEWVRAAKTLAGLGRPDLGKQFLRRLIDAKLNDQQLAALAEQFGSATFLGMAARAEMQPEAGQLADAILTAVDRALRDPARIARLIRQLQDPSPEQRYRASTGLWEAHSAAVGPLLAVLADAARAGEQPAVRAVLVEMRSDAVGPLVAVLEASDPKLVAQAIWILAQIGARQTAIYLFGPYASETSQPAVRAVAAAALKRLIGRTPSRRDAVRLLIEQAEAYFDRKQPLREDVDGLVPLWRWDESTKQCISKKLPADEAASALAARLGREAYALAKEDSQVRLLYLATRLEEAAYEVGWDKPLPDGPGTAAAEAARCGPGVIEDLLQYAIARNHFPAATAAARILGRIGTTETLLRQGAQPTALVRATRHPDRRLRMAATDAVIRLQPLQPFPGCSYIPQALGFFAASGGTRRALVAGPSTEDSRRLAGMLAGAGFEVDTAVTGRQLMRLAIASPDYELALIDAAIDQPPIDLLLQQLRQDCRSGTLRVGLIARDGYLPRARQVARRDPLALAFSRPHSDESFAQEMEQLTALAPREFVDHAERQRQAAEALDRLVEFSRVGNKLYDVRSTQGAVLAALYTPGLGTKAAAVLGNLGTAESQQALIELASRWTQPIELRQAALEAFRQSMQAGGILLSTQQILRQYDRYNQSEGLDPATQQILGSILDCIEAPTQRVQATGDGGRGKADGGGPKVQSGRTKGEAAVQGV